MYNLLFNLARKLRLSPILLVLHPKSALKTSGWFKSFSTKSVIDINGNPIPWWTYSFIDFITQRLSAPLKILEFGCGYSTVWLSKLGMQVTASEDYPDWSNQIQNLIQTNSKIINVNKISKSENYSHLLENNYDVIIIDNLGDRMETAIKNIHRLSRYGVLIWDNTDGTDWFDIKDFMFKNGFKEISFTGMVPQELNQSKTTIFYKTDNCLGI